VKVNPRPTHMPGIPWERYGKTSHMCEGKWRAGVIGGVGAYIIMWLANKVLDWLTAKWNQISGGGQSQLSQSGVSNPSVKAPTGVLGDTEVRSFSSCIVVSPLIFAPGPFSNCW
jgi:hypothetical protein